MSNQFGISCQLRASPMPFSILFNLPENIVSLLLLDWVDVKDISRLDSASCNSHDRDMLLEVLKLPQNVFHASHHDFQCIGWMTLRSMKCGTVSIRCISDPFDMNTFRKFLLLCGSHLKDLVFTMFDNQRTTLSSLLKEVVLHSLNVESLCIRTFRQQETVLHLISQLPNLKKLDIVGGQIVSTTLQEEDAIVSLRQLRSIVLTGHEGNPFNQPFFLSILRATSCLTQLDLNFVHGLNFEEIADLCPHLEVLSLHGTAIGANHLILISEKCKNITSLDLHSHWCGSDDSTYEVVFRNLRLQTLYFNHAYVSNTVISYIGKYLCKTLTTLYMCRVEGHCDYSVYWDVLQQCNRLHTLTIDAPELFKLSIYRDIHEPENGTFPHVHTLRMQCSDGDVDCHALPVVHEFFPKLRALHVNSGADKIMNSLISTVLCCTQLCTLNVLMISDDVKHAIEEINPRLLIRAVKEYRLPQVVLENERFRP